MRVHAVVRIKTSLVCRVHIHILTLCTIPLYLCLPFTSTRSISWRDILQSGRTEYVR